MYTLNKLRLTFFQELSDTEMFSECETLMDLLKIPYKGTPVVSPVENPDSYDNNRHIHIHWLGESLVKRTKENVMSDFRKKGGKIYPGNKGSNYETFDTDKTDDAAQTLRYPMKTGINEYFPLQQKYFPEWFNIEYQASLAAIQYEARLEHEKIKQKREEAHKGSHGGDLYKSAIDRHESQPFKTVQEILLFLNSESMKSDNLGISVSRITDMTNKLMQLFGIITQEQFVQMIINKNFRDI